MDNTNAHAQFATAGLSQRPLSLYAQIISQATGVTDDETLAMIEAVMRHDIFHSTLDWQTREQLAGGARQALALLNAGPEPEKNESEGVAAQWLAERNSLASRNATLLALLERALPFVRKAVEEANAQRDGEVFSAGMAILREANVQIDAAAATGLAAKTSR